MAKSPPIPKEQRSFKAPAHDRKTELSNQPEGTADANLDEQGRFGNIRQNLTPQRSVQDR